eukprot:ctg_505.g186
MDLGAPGYSGGVGGGFLPPAGRVAGAAGRLGAGASRPGDQHVHGAQREPAGQYGHIRQRLGEGGRAGGAVPGAADRSAVAVERRQRRDVMGAVCGRERLGGFRGFGARGGVGAGTRPGIGGGGQARAERAHDSTGGGRRLGAPVP